MHGLFFDVRPKPGHMVHYFEHVERLKPVLARHAGLHYLERFRPLDDPDALLSHQLWQNEVAIAAWRSDATHRASQSAGRRIHFEDYRIRVGPVSPDAQLALSGQAAQERFLVAVYGAPQARLGRVFESVTSPGRFLTLADAQGAAEAQALASAARSGGAAELRVFRIVRDYTMTDRAEAP